MTNAGADLIFGALKGLSQASTLPSLGSLDYISVYCTARMKLDHSNNPVFLWHLNSDRDQEKTEALSPL